MKINLYTIKRNAEELASVLTNKGISLNAVTKGFASDQNILEALYEAGIRVFSDSRVLTGKKIKEWSKQKGYEIKACLLRPPSPGEVEEAALFFDRFYLSDLRQFFLLDEALGKFVKEAEAIIMVETGDSREGFLFEEIEDAVKQIKKLRHLRLAGFGTNTTCLNRSIPTYEEIEIILQMTDRYCGSDGLPSPGNSGALYLLKNGLLPSFKGELRIGEAILLGNETVEYEKLPFLSNDAFTIYADVIEIRKKAYDKIQVVVAIGIADIGFAKVTPLIRGLKEARRSSDHLVLLVDKDEDRVLREIEENGRTVGFRPTYFSLLQSFLTKTVYKEFLEK
ncbi:MAG: alanine racemase [Actinobacteria bacterium]|nr:alanine racemase [Actinomycetota bacterium]